MTTHRRRCVDCAPLTQWVLDSYKKNEEDLCKPAWGDFQGILLSEKNKIQESVYRVIYFVQGKWYKNVCVHLLTQRNTGRGDQKLTELPE